MDENEYKMILGVYQKKTHEMLAQIIALETRVIGLNNVVEPVSYTHLTLPTMIGV